MLVAKEVFTRALAPPIPAAPRHVDSQKPKGGWVGPSRLGTEINLLCEVIVLLDQGQCCRWNIAAWKKGKLAVRNHGARKVGHHRQCLGVKVAEDGIRFPAADELDNIGIDLATEECHGPAGTEGTGAIFRR